METVSLIHHHAVGPHTQRTRTLTSVSSGAGIWSSPLDRQVHGSMRSPDVVTARLSFRVHAGGLELRTREGCREVCRAERCDDEQKLVATICAAAGDYRWDGARLVHP